MLSFSALELLKIILQFQSVLKNHNINLEIDDNVANPMVQSYINIEMLQTQYVEKESHIDLKIGDNNSINQYKKGHMKGGVNI